MLPPGTSPGHRCGRPLRSAAAHWLSGAAVIEEMMAGLGPGPVTAPMTAYVFRAAA
ncbi:hypothetical protein [Streptomyces sp. NPDC048419]|uniref:hypothetical protein n=1 Tax=Streptomyces sp. NPDC048419 TaxID=3365547 RepID=UPI003716277D